MIYGILVLTLVVALILFRERARRIFWAWMVVFVSFSIYDYREIEAGKTAVRATLAESFWTWKFSDLSSALAERSRENAGKLADGLPLHWWEDNFERYALREGVTNQWLLAVEEQRQAARVAVEQEKKKKVAMRKAAEGWRTLSIQSQPPGATIEIDGRSLGETPGEIELLPGTYRITVAKAGFSSWSDLVAVRAGSSPKITVGLSRPPESSDVRILW